MSGGLGTAAGLAASGGNPAGAVAGQLVGGVLQGVLGGQPAPTVSANSSVVYVGNTGINLGEILKPYNEGSLTNGGYGIPIASRLIDNLSDQQSISLEGVGGSLSFSPWILIAAGGALVVILAARKRK